MAERTRAEEGRAEAASLLPSSAHGFEFSTEHKALNVRGVLLQIALGAYIIINLSAITATFAAASFIERAYAGLFESEEAFNSETLFLENITGAIFWTSLGVMAVCVVAYCVFVYGAAKNIDRLNTAGMTDSPGWAVGWTFIPFANLYKPYQVMKEIWVNSHDPVHAAVSAPAFMLLWWIPYIIGNFISNVLNRVMMTTDDPQQLITMGWIDAGASALSVVSALVLIYIVHKIVVAQAAWSSIAPPPPAPVDPNAPLF